MIFDFLFTDCHSLGQYQSPIHFSMYACTPRGLNKLQAVLGTVEEEEELDLVEETELVKDGVLVLGTVEKKDGDLVEGV